MSQSAIPETLEIFEGATEEVATQAAPMPTMSVVPSADMGEFQEFSYRPVPILAPVTFVLGILASIGLMGIVGLAFGVFGIIVGAFALLKIRRAQGELGGRVVTWVGVVLSALFLVGGSSLHAYTFATEIPDGFQRVNFYRDISKKGFLFSNGRSDFHPDVKAIDNKPIFIKGYMYPTQQTENLGSFLLVKDSGDCCFGGQPAVTDMIVVNMQGGKTVNYREGLVSVAGTFHCQPSRGLAEVTENPVYVLDGISMERARTQF
ncbi:MAG: DUF3299 domain-containing protein [Planctomycetaceae bacterium]